MVTVTWSVIMACYLFLWYLIASYFRRRKQEIKNRSVVFYYSLMPVLVLGFIIDVIYNIFPGSLIFLQLPRYGKRPDRKREITLSMRLHNIRHFGHGWRLMVADFICERILNPFDHKHHHC